VAAGGGVQAARYEFKYLVHEHIAEQIRHFVLSYLEPDAYTVGREGVGYPVHSLYLDTPDLQLCRATMEGLKNRFKLRIRFYESAASRVFFEIKRRVNDVILKQRAAVKPASVERLVSGKPPQRADLVCCDERNSFALYNFCRLRDELGAIPAAYTSYIREGYEPQGSNVCRVTFDRALRAGDFSGQLGVSSLERWSRPEVAGTVLELKFTDTFPNWMQVMVEAFNLTRTSMPKYVKCVSLLRSTRPGSPLMSAFERPAVVGIPDQTLLLCA
jgi:hypothetical protein